MTTVATLDGSEGWLTHGGRLQRHVAIRDDGATTSVSLGNTRRLVSKHQETTAGLAEVTVGVEDDGGGLATCDRAGR